MRLVVRFFIIAFSVGAIVVLFFPGRETYFALERYLQKNHIYISEKKIKELTGGFAFYDGNVYYQGVDIGRISKGSCHTRLVSTTCRMLNIDTNREFQFSGVGKIALLEVHYAVYKPWIVSLRMDSDQGTLDGYVDLLHRKITLRAKDGIRSNYLRTLFKRDKQGWYYEFAY